MCTGVGRDSEPRRSACAAMSFVSGDQRAAVGLVVGFPKWGTRYPEGRQTSQRLGSAQECMRGGIKIVGVAIPRAGGETLGQGGVGESKCVERLATSVSGKRCAGCLLTDQRNGTTGLAAASNSRLRSGWDGLHGAMDSTCSLSAAGKTGALPVARQVRRWEGELRRGGRVSADYGMASTGPGLGLGMRTARPQPTCFIKAGNKFSRRRRSR